MTSTSGSPRRRRAEAAHASSDVLRQRAWPAAAAACALSVAFALVLRDGPRSLAAPGPLARPHAALACAACHSSPAASAASSCSGCHGAHPSTRPAHRALSARGVLTCPSCHGVHSRESGIAFEPDGSVSLYASGAERRLSASATEGGTALLGAATTFVPLVGREACSSCHDAARPADPAAHCFAEGTPYSLCFDEHRRSGAASATTPARRDAAVESARDLARNMTSRDVAAAALGPDAGCIVLGLGVAGLVVALDRRRFRASSAVASRAGAPSGPRRLPVIDTVTCLGCQACVDACPYDALAVKRYVAVLARPELCCGAGPCQEACPNGSLSLVAGSVVAPGPRVSETLESLERPGIFLAGDVSGGSLIRNALRQGVLVARTVAARAPRSAPPQPGRLDLVIVGAGPAGLAAALTAQRLGLRTLVLEQAELASSIRSFSREKLVLDATSPEDEGLPLFIGDCAKEELVARWQRTIRAARLEVREGARVLAIIPDPALGFRVRAELAGAAPFEACAQSVLLAIGTRGTPRELEASVAEEARASVHYELSDARAFAGKRVVVVGLGDVAMESALALAAQPGTEVTMLQRGRGFRRGKQRNIDALSALAAGGRVRLVFEARVERVEKRVLEARVEGARRSFPYDAVFVHVGRVPVNALLTSTGIASGNQRG